MEGQCNYFVTRKKRFCRMTVRSGEKYCGEHTPKTSIQNDIVSENQQKNSRLRMACPLDPKHTCFVSKLEKHLKVCNAKEDVLPPFIQKNCNISDDPNSAVFTEGDGSKRSLANVSVETLTEVVALVEKIYEDIIYGKISPCIPSIPHPCVDAELNVEGRGDNTKKHLLQTSSLLRIIEAEGLINEDTCYVELGAGKGQVSYYLSSAFGQTSGCSVLLVDRASHRHKQDNRLEDGARHDRVRADIADLLLKNVPVVESSKNVVAVSKHLCGVATDLALRCLTKADIVEKTKGVVMATCCHHRCIWESYVGRFFLEEQNISSSQFNVICGLVSWATCGTGFSRERRAFLNNRMSSKQPKKAKYDDGSDIEDDSSDGNNSVDDDVNDTIFKDVIVTSSTDIEKIEDGLNIKKDEIVRTNDANTSLDGDNILHKSATKNLGLSLPQRAEVGFKAKAILDWGRLLFLNQKNFKTRLAFYVDKDVSPENVCIIATKEKI